MVRTEWVDSGGRRSCDFCLWNKKYSSQGTVGKVQSWCMRVPMVLFVVAKLGEREVPNGGIEPDAEETPKHPLSCTALHHGCTGTDRHGRQGLTRDSTTELPGFPR